MVCIFCVYLSVEFREALKRHWMKWRYGILIETVRNWTTIQLLIRAADLSCSVVIEVCEFFFSRTFTWCRLQINETNT